MHLRKYSSVPMVFNIMTMGPETFWAAVIFLISAKPSISGCSAFRMESEMASPLRRNLLNCSIASDPFLTRIGINPPICQGIPKKAPGGVIVINHQSDLALNMA